MSFLSGLNENQRKAVEHFNGPLLVVAGAGSGKTRALTQRIANLIGTNEVDPSEVLAVTFTNKAAFEMKERLENLLCKKLSEKKYGQPMNTLKIEYQRDLKNTIYHNITKELWIGTFHALFARLLRFDIDKYKDPEGLTWTRQFSIYDESDAQSLIKEIVIQELQLDPKRFEPKKIRWAISNAKNQGLLPEDLAKNAEGQRDKLIAESYKLYKHALSANNALDFDDLLLIPVQLLIQNKSVREYWHNRFRHILVDEYQDTNHTQYKLIKLLVTGGKEPSEFNDWNNRSVFVVGDADQSIYSFRAADFRILMGFQEDFGNNAGVEGKSTMVKLEDNYRSTSTILDAANSLISNNKERIDKVLRATRGEGESISLIRCDDEISEAEAVIHRVRMLHASNPELLWKNIAILYRTNAQSRAIEESLVRWSIPYLVVGGLRFYDRKEIKDILAYLRLILNSSDSVSLLRVINIPKRGIGKTTIQRLVDASTQLGIPLWSVISDKEAVMTLAGRSARNLLEFAKLIKTQQESLNNCKPSDLIQNILEDSGYLRDLINTATDESEERRRNLQELINASIQYEEENEEPNLEGFLSSAALASDADSKDTSSDRITLMTLHSSKGLEFPIVCLVGLEQGLFPSYRSLDNPSALEEERRLCYVGITRAKERLFISYANERRTWGGMREPALPSCFLSEIPDDLLTGDIPLSGGAAIKKDQINHRIRVRSIQNKQKQNNMPLSEIGNVKNQKDISNISKNIIWKIGDILFHEGFGEGKITHIFGTGSKISIAVKFNSLVGSKILDPRLAPIKLKE